MRVHMMKKPIEAVRIHHGGKSLVVSYMLLVLTGEFGGHRFYLGRPWTGTLIACLSLLPVLALPATMVSGGLDGLPAPGGSGLMGLLDGNAVYAPSIVVVAWLLVDAMRIPGWVRETEVAAEGEATFGR